MSAAPRRMASALARIEPAHVLMILIGAAVVAINVGPVTEVDSFWHVLIGREILDTRSVSNLGDAWSTVHPAHGWVTSQWLSEVIMTKAVDVLGWSGLVWMRGLLAVILLVEVAVVLLRRASPRVAAVVFLATALPITGVVQERPLLLSLLFVPWLAAISADLLLDRRAPRWWAVGLLVVLWANLHGMWVLAPAAFGLVALARAVDRSDRRPGDLAVPLRLLATSLVAGCLTPIGPMALTLPLAFSRAASGMIEEWQRTTLWDLYPAGLVALVAISVACWARSTERVPRAELVYVAGWSLFALPALRNVAPAALMLSPVVAVRMTMFFGRRRAATTTVERRVLVATSALIVLAGAGWWMGQSLAVDPLSKAKPLAIARTLAEQPGPKRVLNGYNSAGVLAAFGGPRIQLAVDGRADRYGRDYLQRYVQVIAGGGDWRGFVRDLDPDFAVLPEAAGLVSDLEQSGWTLVQHDNGYVLLRAPAR